MKDTGSSTVCLRRSHPQWLWMSGDSVGGACLNPEAQWNGQDQVLHKHRGGGGFLCTKFGLFPNGPISQLYLSPMSHLVDVWVHVLNCRQWCWVLFSRPLLTDQVISLICLFLNSSEFGYFGGKINTIFWKAIKIPFAFIEKCQILTNKTTLVPMNLFWYFRID